MRPQAGTIFQRALAIKLICFCLYFVKTNVLNLGIAKNGFEKAKKVRWRLQ
jgi:hypothetical protein